LLRHSVALLAATLALAGSGGAASAAAAMPALSDPPSGLHLSGKFIWFDLATTDPAAAQRFYGSVFGWSLEPVAGAGGRYAVIRNDGRPIGGVFRPAPARGQDAGARWLSFASVEKLDGAVDAMTGLGATVLVKPTRVPGRGNHAILRDAQGAVIGLLQSASGDRPDEPVAPGEFFWVDLFIRDPASAGDTYGRLGLEVLADDVSGSRERLLPEPRLVVVDHGDGNQPDVHHLEHVLVLELFVDQFEDHRLAARRPCGVRPLRRPRSHPRQTTLVAGAGP
jgi:predicted enzyme related to lactoylglutathione lyase